MAEENKIKNEETQKTGLRKCVTKKSITCLLLVSILICAGIFFNS